MFGFIGFIFGVLFLILGVFLVFFFPTTTVHQLDSMSYSGIAIGLIFLVLGYVLAFL